MATIQHELDTGLAIRSRQHRGNVPADTVEEYKEYVPRQTQTVATIKHVICSSDQHHARRGKRISVEDISDHDLTSKEEEEEDKENNGAEKGSPQSIWISSATVG
ncbi:hypothetical protein DSO57_1012902 [Entomophthora muscae]|uniref:Uncharacterized protein n=1 Tax=Entomophthora muscae TaxID=34485 RepID=A0ACC2SIW6_9FUNG|nr:hypothetical protein DSO57_1012902 [Entomophthora muscae]